MMYRIHFDPRISLFIVQVLCWGFWWRTVRHNISRGAHGETPAYEPRTWNTYEEARKWCRSIGLHEAYGEQQSPKDKAVYFGAGLK